MNEKELGDRLSSIQHGDIELPEHRLQLRQALIRFAQMRDAPAFNQGTGIFNNFFKSRSPAARFALICIVIVIIGVLPVSVTVLADRAKTTKTPNLQVTEVPGLTAQPYWPTTFPTSVNPHFGPPQTSLNFDSIKQLMGRVWVPGYLPEGYVFQEGRVVDDNSLISLNYRSSLYTWLNIKETISAANFHLPAGTTKDVMVDDNPGYFIYGGWSSVNGGPVTWSDTISRNLVFSMDGWVIIVTSNPSDELNDDELIKIAESLVEY